MRLFKFLPSERIAVLRDNRIRFTQPLALDDPFEFRPDVTFGEDDRKGIIAMAPPGTSEARKAAAALEGIKKKPRQMSRWVEASSSLFGLLCLAQSPRSLAMWSYYAEGHRGFVIEFDPAHEFFREGDGSSGLRRVKYTKRRARLVMEPENPEKDEALARAVITTKAPVWRHEKEVRFARHLFTESKTDKCDQRGFSIHLFPLPADCIKRVILGFRMSEEDRRAIRGVLQAERYGHVRVELAELHDSEFGLEFRPY